MLLFAETIRIPDRSKQDGLTSKAESDQHQREHDAGQRHREPHSVVKHPLGLRVDSFVESGEGSEPE